jgi:hypothetical protein
MFIATPFQATAQGRSSGGRAAPPGRSVPQTVLAVVAEVVPEAAEALRNRIRALAATRPDGTRIRAQDKAFRARLDALPGLHFLSMAVFEDKHFDPVLVFENNFDGTPAEYWPGVERAFGPELRGVLACTKAAADPRWAALFAPGATASLISFLDAHTVLPAARHLGHPGLSAARINAEAQLFDRVQVVVDEVRDRLARLAPEDAHHLVRARLLPEFPWLDEAAAPRRAPGEQAANVGRLALFAGGVASPLLVAAGLWAGRRRKAAAGTLLLAAAGAAGAVRQLRRLEETDPVQDRPAPDRHALQRFSESEDNIVQNHIASMVLVKPGALRAVLLRLGLRVLKRAVPVIYADGYLGTMRTIHFAHWSLIGNGGRLLFLSNFDGSWQSYLDDFVDKAHVGLTLAWSNCVGFPRTRLLVEGGATKGRQFKAWARLSQTESLLWHSAYPSLTVNQIERNTRVADGLRNALPSAEEAAAWMDQL